MNKAASPKEGESNPQPKRKLSVRRHKKSTRRYAGCFLFLVELRGILPRAFIHQTPLHPARRSPIDSQILIITLRITQLFVKLNGGVLFF